MFFASLKTLRELCCNLNFVLLRTSETKHKPFATQSSEFVIIRVTSVKKYPQTTARGKAWPFHFKGMHIHQGHYAVARSISCTHCLAHLQLLWSWAPHSKNEEKSIYSRSTGSEPAVWRYPCLDRIGRRMPETNVKTENMSNEKKNV